MLVLKCVPVNAFFTKDFPFSAAVMSVKTVYRDNGTIKRIDYVLELMLAVNTRRCYSLSREAIQKIQHRRNRFEMNKSIKWIILAAAMILLAAMIVVLCLSRGEQVPKDQDMSGSSTMDSESVNDSASAEQTDPSQNTQDTQDTTVGTQGQEQDSQQIGTSGGKQPQSAEAPTDESQSTSASEPAQDPTTQTDANQPTAPAGTGAGYTYEEYVNLSAAEQQAYFESFASVDAFFAWYNAVKKRV